MGRRLSTGLRSDGPEQLRVRYWSPEPPETGADGEQSSSRPRGIHHPDAARSPGEQDRPGPLATGQLDTITMTQPLCF